MSIFKSLWKWLNGNKTIFGIVLREYLPSIPVDYQLFGFIPLYSVASWLSGILMTGGVAHKLYKIAKPKE